MLLDTSVVDVVVVVDDSVVVVVVDTVVVVDVVNGVGSVLVSLSLFSLKPTIPDVFVGVGTSFLFLVGVRTLRLVPDDCVEVGTLPEFTNILGDSVAPILLWQHTLGKDFSKPH